MKTVYRACGVMGLPVGLLAIVAGEALGQPPNGPAESAEWMRKADYSFSLSRREDVDRLIMVRNLGALEATLALEKLTRNEYNRDDDEPHRAAQVLAWQGTVDSRALAALCDNILTLKGNDNEVFPLSGFKAAQALVHIGGSRARNAIFASLHQPLDRRGLLIRAHVLAEVDPPQIMCEHIKLAIAELERLHAAKVVDDNDDEYLANLRQLHDWLSDPEFLQNNKSWP